MGGLRADALWPVAVIFLIYAVVYGGGLALATLGHPVERRGLDVVVGLGVLAVAVGYLLDTLAVSRG